MTVLSPIRLGKKFNEYAPRILARTSGERAVSPATAGPDQRWGEIQASPDLRNNPSCQNSLRRCPLEAVPAFGQTFPFKPVRIGGLSQRGQRWDP